MDVDDEALPLLVASGDAVEDEVPDLVDAAVGDLSLTKVPITVITGMYTAKASSVYFLAFPI